MDFSLNEEQKQIKALVKDFCEREVEQKRLMQILRKNDASKTIEEIRANYPWDLEQKAHKAGLQTIGVPTKYGGPGPDTEIAVTMAIAKEQAGYSGGLAAWFLIGPGFLLQSIRPNPYVSEKEKEQLFSGLLKFSGKKICGTISEPGGHEGGGGGDIHMPWDEGGSKVLTVTARKDGDGWVINGDKMFSGDGAIADIAEVFARTKEGPISESASWFYVPVNTPGITRSLNKLIFTDFGGNCQYHYDNVRVPAEALFGEPHTGFKGLSLAFQYKWQIRCHGVGLAQKLYENMRDFAKQRIASGRPIIQYTHVAARLGDLALRLETLRAIMYKVAWETDRMEESSAIAPGAGSWYWYWVFLNLLKEVSWKLCEAAHDIYGSIATSDDLPVESFLRYNLMWRGAALPPEFGLVRLSMDYDDRYYYER